jgi:uncharacterized membrane protein
MVLWFVLVEYLLPASVLGVLAGRITSVVLRQDRGAKAVALDIIFALVFMVLWMFALPVIYAAQTTVSFSESLGVGLTVSTASVVVRHLILLTLRSSGTATSA